MSLSELFIDVTSLPENGYGMFQLVFLGGVYAYVLMYASNMISDGSELLLLIPSLAGLVGSVVLPVLGAVPDGCIVLFSGIGPDAQEQLSVGIGALAGSTIMLLTAPWFLSVLGGRVNLSNGVPIYKGPQKLTNSGWFDTGVSLGENVNTGGLLMAITSISYLIIQIPGLVFGNYSTKMVGILEQPYALTALLTCLFCFCGYLYFQYLLSDEELQSNIRLEQIIEKIQRGDIALRGVILAELRANNAAGENKNLMGGFSTKIKKDMETIVRPFFKKYDADNNNSLSMYELKGVFRDLGENPDPAVLKRIFEDFDLDKNGKIEYDEFVQGITTYVQNNIDDKKNISSKESNNKKYDGDIEMLKKVEDNDDEEEEEMPEEFAELSPEQQQVAVGYKAAWMLSLGTVLVVLFSDPMVDVLSELGARTGIPAFYVSFVLAPLASNASEVIASYNYAQKKTAKSMTISLSALQGACCMNNTFVLGIFMICVYTQNLAWEFFAETLSILFSVLFIAAMSLKKSHTLFDALVIMLMYPVSLILVYMLEAYGWN